MSSSTSSSAAPSRSISPVGRHPKGIDLRGYFAGCDGESAPSPRRKHSKSTKPPLRQRAPAKRPALRPTLVRTPSGDQDDGGEWEAAMWDKLVTKQREQEEHVRRAILARNAVGAVELKKWLDSDDTCTLPEPSLGVRIRTQVASA